MTSGNCVFGCGFQADLDGHYYSYHHMSMPTQAMTPPKASSTLSTPTPIQAVPPAHDPTKYCFNCGHKYGAQTWKEVVIAFVRYNLMVFWIGSFVGALSGFEIAAKIFGH